MKSNSHAPHAVFKPVRTTACLTLTAALLAACSGGGASNVPAANSGSASDSSAAKPLEIQMTVRLFDQVPDMNNAYWKEYQKRTNTKLNVEWIPDGDYTTKLNLILASGNIPEVLVANNLKSPALVSAVKNGAFWDLTPFLGDFSKYPNLKNNSAPGAWETSRILGKIYGIPQNVAQVSNGPKIRKDWLTKLGLPMPKTVEEFREALKKIVAADLDGNGKQDTLGVIAKTDLLGTSTGGFSSAFGADKPTYNAEGGLIYNKLTPQFTDTVNYFRQLYADGSLAQEFAVMKSTQAQELFQTGKAAAYLNESMRWDYPFTQSLKKDQPDAEVETVMLQGPGGYTISRGTGVVDIMLISKKVPEEKVRQILDYMEKTTTKEYYDLTVYGVEGIHYNKVDGKIKLTEQRDKDLGSSAPWQVLALYYDKYMKTVSSAAPQEYNDAKIQYLDSIGYYDKGTLDPFAVINSDTFLTVWPKVQQEWISMGVKAIVGQITMDEYKAYVDKINNNPDFKKAYKEFAESYKEYFGK